jgi:hypothetical protein
MSKSAARRQARGSGDAEGAAFIGAILAEIDVA